MVLNIKKIPFETVWVPLHEVEAKAKEVGAKPTGKYLSGKPRYTVPFVKIETPGKETIIISDSKNIAEYFDEMVPEPPLFRKQTAVLDLIAEQYLGEKVIAKLLPVWLVHGGPALDQTAAAYFVTSRVLINGVPFEKMTPQNTEEMVQAKREMYAALDAYADLLDKAGEGNFRLSPYVSYAEITFVAFLHVFKAVAEHSRAGAEHKNDWSTIAAVNAGRWAKLLDVPEYRETRSVYLN